MVSQTCTQHLSSLWTGLYLDLTNAQNLVLREREATGDKQINVHLKTLPQITQDVRRLVEMLVEEIDKFNQDGPCFEYFLRNEIPAELVRFSLENIPEGGQSLVLSFFTALLSALPAYIFSQERIVTPMRKSFALSVTHFKATKDKSVAGKLLKFLDYLTIRLGEYPPLKEVLDDEFISSCCIFLCAMIENELLVDSTQSVILAGTEGGLVRGEQWNDMLVSEVCTLMRSFDEADAKAFLSHLKFLDMLTIAAKRDDFIPSQIMSLYRQLFVDRIFSTFLLGSSVRDGSRSFLWDLLMGLCQEFANSDLLLPLLSKAIRLFEKVPNIEMDRLNLLYTQMIGLSRVARCFPSKRPSPWTESVTVHRQRLDTVFSLLARTGLPPFIDPEMVSSYHRIHLMTVESLMGDDLKIKLPLKGSAVAAASPSSLRTSQISQVLDNTKNVKLARLMASSKAALTLYWSTEAGQNLWTIRLLAGCLVFSDSPEFYGELLSREAESLLGLVHRIVKEKPTLGYDEDVIAGMGRLHFVHDPLEADCWDPALTGMKDAVVQHTLNTYLLGHFLMRIAATCQVRATRSSTVIVYD